MAIAEKQIHMTAAVLCGGRSSRFGSPKEWLDFDGRPLLTHVVHTVRPLFSHVLAVGLGPGAPPLPEDVEPVADTAPGAGPLNGIVSALRVSKTEHTFFFACDTPLIRPALVRAMQAQAAGAHAVVPRSGPHYQPLFAIYARACLPVAEKQLAEGRLKISDMFPLLTMRFIDEHQQRLHDHTLLSFFNINTRQDYERALDLLHPGRAPMPGTAAD